MKAFAIGLVLVCLSTVADAGSSIIGAGSQTCTAWTNRKKNAVVKGSFESWLVGFISGLNISGERDMVGGGDFDAIIAGWINAASPLRRTNRYRGARSGYGAGKESRQAIADGKRWLTGCSNYLPFQFGVRLLRNASIPSRKSSLI